MVKRKIKKKKKISGRVKLPDNFWKSLTRKQKDEILKAMKFKRRLDYLYLWRIQIGEDKLNKEEKIEW